MTCVSGKYAGSSNGDFGNFEEEEQIEFGDSEKKKKIPAETSM